MTATSLRNNLHRLSPLLTPGSILLTRNRGLGGKLNSTYQRIRRWREHKHGPYADNFIPTHASLVLGLDDIIHSIKTRGASISNGKELLAAFQYAARGLWASRDKRSLAGPTNKWTLALTRSLFGYGVERVPASVALSKVDPLDMMLIRHPAAPPFGDANFTATLGRRAMHYLDMPYNRFIELSSGRGMSVFCSQLVYQVFQESGLELPSAPSNRVLPIDFLIWARQQRWQTFSGMEIVEDLNKYADVGDSSEWSSVMSQQHRVLVDTHFVYQSAMEKLAAMSETSAQIFEKSGQAILRPLAMQSAGIPAIPFNIEAVIRAAELVEDSLLEKTQAASLGDSAQNIAPFSSWLLDSAKDRDIKTRLESSGKPLSFARMDRTQLLLEDLEKSIREALTNAGETSTAATPRSSDSKSALPPSTLDRLAYVLDCIDWKADKDRLSELQEALSKRQEVLTQEIIKLMNEMQSEASALEADLPPSSEAVSSALTEKITAVRLMSWAYYISCVAWDYISTCKLVAAWANDTTDNWSAILSRTSSIKLRPQLELMLQALPAIRRHGYRFIEISNFSDRPSEAEASSSSSGLS